MSGCADRVITLSYTPPLPSSTVSPRLTVFRLADQRGNEGDHADPLRVGGIYGGYGNRLAKVMVTQPWPPRLVSALVAEFRGAGVDAVGTDQLPLTRVVRRPRRERRVSVDLGAGLSFCPPAYLRIPWF